MKNNSFWSIILFVIISLPIIVACGGDDEKESGKIVDGVNVSSGKRLLELQLTGENSKLPTIIKAEYDTKGRLSKISLSNIEYNYDSNKSLVST